MMIRPRWGIWGLLVMSVAACSDAAPPSTARPRPVRVEQVRLQAYAPSVSLTGEIRARVQTDLSFRVSGRVSERMVDVGQNVTADQILARIEPREQDADVLAANAAVEAAEAQLKQASAAFERQADLLQRGFTTRATHDQAQAAQRTAEGSLIAAKAQAETAKESQSYTVLRAGTTGVITARNIEVGQVAQAGQAAFTLAVDGPRDAVFYVYESIFSSKPATDAIELTLVGNPAVKATGRVREVAPTVDVQSATVRVKVGIDALPEAMPLGSSVIGVGHPSPRDAVILPWSALTELGDSPAVWIVDPASKTTSLRKIEIGAYQASSFIVQNGLQPGDLVVTDGGKLLRPNQAVAVAERTAQ
jgi:RND family efflux transporter MFP subunit